MLSPWHVLEFDSSLNPFLHRHSNEPGLLTHTWLHPPFLTEHSSMSEKFSIDYTFHNSCHDCLKLIFVNCSSSIIFDQHQPQRKQSQSIKNGSYTFYIIFAWYNEFLGEEGKHLNSYQCKFFYPLEFWNPVDNRIDNFLACWYRIGCIHHCQKHIHSHLKVNKI